MCLAFKKFEGKCEEKKMDKMSQSSVYMPNNHMAKYINVKGKRKEISNKDS